MHYHRLETLRGRDGVSSGLWIILLEAGLALALLLALVWWTLPKKPGKTKGPQGAREDSTRSR